jgi:hypothetical protein
MITIGITITRRIRLVALHIGEDQAIPAALGLAMESCFPGRIRSADGEWG